LSFLFQTKCRKNLAPFPRCFHELCPLFKNFICNLLIFVVRKISCLS
jgi:hypothetical protein